MIGLGKRAAAALAVSALIAAACQGAEQPAPEGAAEEPPARA